MAEGKKTGTKRTTKAAAVTDATVSAAAKQARKAAPRTEAAPVAPAVVESAVAAPAVAEPVVAAQAVEDVPVAAAPASTNGHREPATVSPEDRAAMVAHAAYLRAERRQFAPGDDQADWFEAEREIEELLSQRSHA